MEKNDAFYKKTGSAGGRAPHERPPGYFSKIGRLGGRKTVDKYGKQFLSDIATIGGNKVKEMYGREFYSKIGKMKSTSQDP